MKKDELSKIVRNTPEFLPLVKVVKVPDWAGHGIHKKPIQKGEEGVWDGSFRGFLLPAGCLQFIQYVRVTRGINGVAEIHPEAEKFFAHEGELFFGKSPKPSEDSVSSTLKTVIKD